MAQLTMENALLMPCALIWCGVGRKRGQESFQTIRKQGEYFSMMNQPSISVIVPVHNGEHFLYEALQSIKRQNYQPMEVLVIDDGSTDQSAAVAEACSEVRVLRKKHSGLAATLNHGIDHATGQLFAFLDADDRWLPEKLMRQVAELVDRPGLDMVFCHIRQFTSLPDIAGGGEKCLSIQAGISKTSMLIRRASFYKVGKFTEDTAYHDFLDWYARAQAFNLSASILPEVLAERRIHNGNMGSLYPDLQRKCYLKTLRAVVRQRHQPPLHEGVTI